MTSIKRAFAQPAFFAAVIVLLVCGIALNAVGRNFKWQKGPVPLRVGLKAGIPENLGHWVSVSPDTAIDPEVETVLGTSEYIFRDYVDDRKVTPDEIEHLKNDPEQKRQMLLSQIQGTKPSAVLRVGITYYTGMVDTVAHVPDRCYVADGFEVKQSEEIKATLGNYPDGSPRDIKFRFLSFEDQTGMGQKVQRVARNVGYVFHCNGTYLPGANDVRLKLQNLFERYGYYAKVELMTAATLDPRFKHGAIEANNHDESVAAMENFYAEALPELEKCLADWQALHNKK